MTPARLVLNYKNLPYRTEWMEYPDIIPRLSALYAPHKHIYLLEYFTC